MKCLAFICVGMLTFTLAGAATATGDATSAATTAATAAAPQWTTDLAAFANQNRGNWVVAKSSGPGITADEALDAARAEAARTLVPKLQMRMRTPADHDWLRQNLDAALGHYHGFIADQHLVKNVRPYGETWTASILVDAAPKHLESLALDLDRRLDRQRARIARFLGGSGALVVVTVAAFVLANWLTRGFLRLRLAVASIVVILIGIAGLTQTL